MNAFISDACLIGQNFIVYNRYIGAGVIGPGKKIEFPFKIKAPEEEGIYMLKFFADIKDQEGKHTGHIDYYIPITVSSSVEISPLDVSEESIKLEVTNEGISKVYSVAVLASDIGGIELQKERVYIGEMKNGESAIAVFNISKVAAEGVESSAVFRVVYKNGVNKHESESICVGIPFRNIKEEGKSIGSQLANDSFIAFKLFYPKSLNWSYFLSFLVMCEPMGEIPYFYTSSEISHVPRSKERGMKPLRD